MSISDNSEPALVFHDTTFSVIDRDGQQWLRGNQIGAALGYADEKAIPRIYARHADEFSDEMTRVVNLTTHTGERETRVFSLRGAHLLAMFSRTSVATEFRRWVLDVLDRESSAKAGDIASNEHALRCFRLCSSIQQALLNRLLDMDETTIKQKRLLLSISHDGAPIVREVPNDAYVLALQEVSQILRDAHTPISTETLSQIAASATDRITRRAKYYESKSAMAKGKQQITT